MEAAVPVGRGGFGPLRRPPDSCLVLDFLAPPPVHGGVETLEFIAANKANYIAEQILWILPNILPVLVFTALFVALAPTQRSLALIALIFGALP